MKGGIRWKRTLSKGELKGGFTKGGSQGTFPKGEIQKGLQRGKRD